MKEYFSNEMIFAKINAEGADSTVATKYKVSGYPTFVLVDSEGEEVDRIVGYLEAPDFLETVKNYKNGIGTLGDLLSQAEESSDRQLYFDIADKYKYRGGADDAKVWFQKVVDSGEPTDSLSGEGRFALADMFRRSKDYDQAIEAFKNIKNDFKGSDFAMFAEGADIYTAICYRYNADTTSAVAAFEQFIKDYPESEDLDYAQKQVAKLTGANEEEI